MHPEKNKLYVTEVIKEALIYIMIESGKIKSTLCKLKCEKKKATFKSKKKKASHTLANLAKTTKIIIHFFFIKKESLSWHCKTTDTVLSLYSSYNSQ